jgi:predicted  nucleic acid-binding Zn-ribbon protein
MQKADTSKLEKEGLTALNKVDEVRQQVNEAEKRVEAEQGRLREVQAEQAAIINDTKTLLEQLEAQRAEAAEGISSQVLQLFERVAEHHDGQAMARVIQSHPKREEYICEGCNMSITLETVNALRTRDDVQQCTVCGRLLYLDESLNAPTRARS